MEQFLVELGKSGPWAMVAGFLLWQVIKAWNKDRDQVTGLLGEFKTSIDKLSVEIHNLAQSQDRIFRHIAKDKRDGE